MDSILDTMRIVNQNMHSEYAAVDLEKRVREAKNKNEIYQLLMFYAGPEKELIKKLIEELDTKGSAEAIEAIYKDRFNDYRKFVADVIFFITRDFQNESKRANELTRNTDCP